jgi:BON domain
LLLLYAVRTVVTTNVSGIFSAKKTACPASKISKYTEVIPMKMKVAVCFSAIAMLAVLLAAVGCSKPPGDAQIASDIQNKLSTDSGLQGKQLVVQAANGTVTLSGAVDNDAEREAAAKYAASEPGVKTVVNNLEVASPAPMQQQASVAPPPEQSPEPTPKPSASSSRRHHNSAARRDRSSDNDAQNNPNDNDAQAAMTAPAPVVNVSAPPTPATQAPPPPPPPPQKVTIASGTSLSVRLVDPINSETAQEGQIFHASLNTPLSVDGETAIPAGHEVEGHVVTVHSAGKFAGQSLVVLQLDRIKVGGKHYDIQTSQYEKKAASRSTNTAEKVGGGAVLGAIIGGLAGGGKGAGIGAAAGAGVGGGVQAATKSKQIDLPSETVLDFTLQAPLTVTPTTEGPNAGRQKLDSNQ